MQHSVWVTVHEVPNRPLCTMEGSPGTRDKPLHARHKHSSLIAQMCELLTLKDHVVFVVHSARQGGQVCSTTSGAGAGFPWGWRVAVAAELDVQLVTAQPEPSKLPDLLMQCVIEPKVCRHLVRLCRLEVCRICEELPANPRRQLRAAHLVMHTVVVVTVCSGTHPSAHQTSPCSL